MTHLAPLPDPWLRAVGYATAAPDTSEALLGLLEAAVPACRASAGAILDGDDGRCRAVWGCAADEIRALLREGGPVRRTMPWWDPGSGEELQVPHASGASVGGGPLESLLPVPLRVRGIVSGTLLLLYRPEDRPDEDARENAHAFSALIALLLENDRLAEEARLALQARGHFLMALNHELRTPASALVLTADLLRSGAHGPLPEPVDSALLEAERHIHEMVGVLRRVLDLGELESHAAPERADILKPREAVTELLRKVEPTANRKQLSLTLYVPRVLPPLQTDASRFSRIILYLLANAIKYTAQGGIEVRLERTVRMSAPGRQEPILVVRVKDTGRGIPAEYLPRIFEPFTQVEEGARTDSRTRGLGLGLPLARQLARSLGGDIAIESAPGRGTLASVHIPYVRQ